MDKAFHVLTRWSQVMMNNSNLKTKWIQCREANSHIPSSKSRKFNTLYLNIWAVVKDWTIKNGILIFKAHLGTAFFWLMGPADVKVPLDARCAHVRTCLCVCKWIKVLCKRTLNNPPFSNTHSHPSLYLSQVCMTYFRNLSSWTINIFWSVFLYGILLSMEELTRQTLGFKCKHFGMNTRANSN